MNSTLPGPSTPATGENHGGELIAAAVTTVAIAAIFVGLRLFTRGYLIKTLSITDWVILTSLVFSIGHTVGQVEQVRLGGVGRPGASLTSEDIRTWMQAGYYTTLAYIASLLATKLSVLLLYLRILSSAFLHRTGYAALGAVGLLGGWSLASSAAACVPVAAFWDPLAHPGAWCWPVAKSWGDVGIHIATEIMILVLPMPYVQMLSMPLREKVGVACLFALGIFVCGVSIGRIPALAQATSPTPKGDPSLNAVQLGIWSSIEINTGIVCACLMTLRPLAARMAPRLVRSGYRRHNNNNHNHNGDEEFGREREHIPLTVGSRRIRRKPRDDLDAALDSTASTTTTTSGGGQRFEMPKLPPESSTSLGEASVMTRETQEGVSAQHAREWPT